jgi:hypothetical protein
VDFVAVGPDVNGIDRVWFLQVTTTDNQAARIKKIYGLADEAIKVLEVSDANIEVWGWFTSPTGRVRLTRTVFTLERRGRSGVKLGHHVAV